MQVSASVSGPPQPGDSSESGLQRATQDVCAGEVLDSFSSWWPPESPPHVYSHGLYENGVGMRSFNLEDPNPASFIAQVRDVWHEYREHLLRIHLVWPQPLDQHPGTHILVEFLPDGNLPHDSIVPTLEETIIWSAFGEPDVQRQALYHSRDLHAFDVTNPFADLCHRARYCCQVRALGRLLPGEHSRRIFNGAFIQLHAHPPRLHEPQEFADYFYRGHSFLSDSMHILDEVFLPSVIWRIHLLGPDGYLGSLDSAAPISSLASIAAVSNVAFNLWNMNLPGALAYVGQRLHGGIVQEFVAFDPDGVGAPCVIQAVVDADVDFPCPPPVAAWLSSVCTLQKIVSALNAN